MLGVFAVIAYPNISSWITDREVKKEVYDTIAFIKERKAEVTSGKYGMTQIVLKPNLEVYTMSPQNFFNTYQDNESKKKVGFITSSIKINDNFLSGLALIKSNFMNKDIYFSEKDESITTKKPISFNIPF